MSIAFLNSFRIFIIFFLNLEPVPLERLVSLFFQGNSVDLGIGSGSSDSSFYLYFSHPMIEGDKLSITTMILEGRFSVRASLCSLHECDVFGARADFSVHACHVLLQCVLFIIPVIGGVTGAVGTRACIGC